MPAKTFDCPFCKQPMRGEALARAASAYAPDLRLHVSSCPNCGEGIEFRAFGGAVEPGYTYWAGSMHFEAVIRLSVSGLRRVGTDGALELKGVRIFTPPPKQAGSASP